MPIGRLLPSSPKRAERKQPTKWPPQPTLGGPFRVCQSLGVPWNLKFACLWGGDAVDRLDFVQLVQEREGAVRRVDSDGVPKSQLDGVFSVDARK